MLVPGVGAATCQDLGRGFTADLCFILTPDLGEFLNSPLTTFPSPMKCGPREWFTWKESLVQCCSLGLGDLSAL